MTPLLVVVTGPPASGKTTLAELLSRELRLPLAAKDAIKERLYDTVGAGDREWSRRLGRATFEHLDDVILEELRAGEHEDQWRPLPLDGELVELEISSADLDSIVARVSAVLTGGIGVSR